MSPVVVVLHLHFPEVWPDIRARLEAALAMPFRLVITTTLAESTFDLPQTPHLVAMQVIPVENRGRDVRPFLEALKAVEPFEIGLKLHGKKSVHRLDGNAWRDALLDSLLPDAEETAAIVARMRADPRIAMVAPQNALCSIDKHVAGNAGAMTALAARLRFDLEGAVLRTPFFAAGTMFWFRRDALIGAADGGLDDVFAREKGQTDGTAAHALERLFAAIAEERGVVLPVDALAETSLQSNADELKQAARERVDRDEVFVRVPGRLGVFAMRYLPFAVPAYRALPDPVRRTIKGGLMLFAGKE